MAAVNTFQIVARQSKNKCENGILLELSVIIDSYDLDLNYSIQFDVVILAKSGSAFIAGDISGIRVKYKGKVLSFSSAYARTYHHIFAERFLNTACMAYDDMTKDELYQSSVDAHFGYAGYKYYCCLSQDEIAEMIRLRNQLFDRA
jgi:hypothetical protein